MRKKIDPVVDEAIETLNMKDGPSRRRLIEGGQRRFQAERCRRTLDSRQPHRLGRAGRKRLAKQKR